MNREPSTNRKVRPPFRGQRGRCCWCGTTEIPKGRRSWCSQDCVDQYMMRSSAEFVRQKLMDRDRGICAVCGCDADAEYRSWRDRSREALRLADRLIRQSRFSLDFDSFGRSKFREWRQYTAAEAVAFRAYLSGKYASGNWTYGRSSGWDADHIVPVCEGGGECDLSNYRTLCHPCHKAATAALAKRRAAARRGAPVTDDSGELFKL